MEHEELHEDKEQIQPVEDSMHTGSAGDVGDETAASSSSAILARLQARFGLGDAALAQETALEVVRNALKDADWQVRTAAARRLGEMGSQADVALLVTVLQHDECSEARAASARALGSIQTSIAEEPLLTAFAQDDDDVREAVVMALGALGSRLSAQAIQILAESFHEEQNEDVRAAIISTLGNCGEQTPQEVVSVAFHDPDWLVREAAVIAMGKQKERADLTALEGMLNDEVQPVCDAAANALNKVVTETRLASDQRTEKDEEPSGGGTAGAAPPTVIGEVRTITSTDTPDSPLAAPAPSMKRGMVGSSGDARFLMLEPPDIEQFYPVVTQAFDDQWVPDNLLQAMLSGKTSYQAIQPYLSYLVRTEYMRSLITSEKLIINRVFIYNNPALYRDILPGQAGRTTFKQFLEQGVIVPFLFNESSPVDIPTWISTVPEGFSAWERICQEVQTQCLRFSWDNEQNQDEAKTQLAFKFHQFALTAETLKLEKLASDLGVDPTQQHEFRNQLARVADESSKYYRNNDRHIVRTHLYEQFVTEGRPALRHYDGAKPFAGAIKQFFDVAYNSNLADSLGGNLLTPAGSPTRLILQEWESAVKKMQSIKAQDLIAMLRRDTFQRIQQQLEQYYLRSMGLLSLNDVQELRKTDEWFEYIAALHRLLDAPVLFGQLADEVSAKYVALIQRVSALVGKRNQQMGGALMAPWQPGVEVTVQVGGEKLVLGWGADGVFSDIPAAQDDIHRMAAKMQTRGRGDALCDIRLTITDGRPSSERANLSSSIEVMKGRMSDARMQFEEVLRKLGEEFKRREFSVEQEVSATLNLQPQTA